MIVKTRGIVFRFTKFGETSIIVTIFTETFGLQSYIVNGVRSKSARNKIALYQPLTLLDLVVYHRENANIERIKDIRCFHPYSSLTTDVRKSAIALFINELLNKTVKDESHAAEIFNFLCESLIILDTAAGTYENFHLQFMLKLSRYLGFGAYNVNEVVGGRMATEEEEKIIGQLLGSEYLTLVPMSAVQRRSILDLIVKFYADHMEHLQELKSLSVLKEVLS